MKIGLFFGSFNPVHIGHLVIAGYMSQFTDLDEVWLVVSPQNPFKQKQSMLAEHHRYRLAEIAVEGRTGLKASNIEFQLSRPSYTIDTLAHLREKYPLHQFSILMGMDNLATLPRWKNSERLLEGYGIYVYPRHGSSAPPEMLQHPNVKVTSAPLMEISATFIRQAIKEKKDVGFMLPAGVYDYIREMHFYER